MASTVVDPMEVFASMTASLLEKQPKPFNPMYAIKPAPPHKLKVGGKPPREVFYRDTLIFMTSLPPPVQSKLCTCKYLCNGDAASIICHSCSIYDPTKAAYYCSKCFPTRHPWYRVPHLHTVIENDESISHTLKVAHRIAEASRYDNEGKGILRKIQNQKPNLAFVADDEKVDNQLREYGRKVTALEDHVLQLRERLRRDIIHGDVIPQRRSLYTNSETDVARGQHLIRMSDESSDLIDSTPTSGTLLDSTRAESATNNSAESTNPEEDGGGEAGGDQTRTKLEQLRRQPIFDSEPLFTSLQESERFDESAPETVGGSGGGWNRADVRKLALTERSPFLRGDTADSADSMTFSPDEGGSFFREDSNFNIARSAGPHLQAIEETDSVVTEPTEAGISPTRQDTTTAVVATTAPLNPQLSLSENPEVTSAAIFPPTGNNDSAAPQWDQVALTEEAEEKGTSLSSPGGLRRVLSGISFTSVAHSDIDSVHPHSFNQHHHEPYLHVTPFGQQTAAATAAATASSSSDPRDRPAPLSGNSNEERTHQHQSKQEQPSLSAKLRSAQSANWLSSIASVEEASLEGSISTMGSSSAASDSDVSSLSKSSISIQRIFKGYLARRTVSKMLTTRLMRVFSLEANRGTNTVCCS